MNDPSPPKLSMFIDTSLIGPPAASIASLSGDWWKLGPDDLRTNVTLTAEEAWHCPIQNLNAEHLRMLVSQRMGLEWISAAIAEFVALYPKAVITNYEGEVAQLALKALADIEACDPRAAQQLRSLRR